ncbi:FitA-like ribbon-helix-helix domain-containing protein [Nostocoides sp.]
MIPDVSERTMARLRARAARNAHTVEDEVRDVLDAATDGNNTMYLFSLHEALSEALEDVAVAGPPASEGRRGVGRASVA